MPRETMEQRRQRAGRIYAGLRQLYPEAHCELNHRNAWELLVATILSAQCTDVRVNMVTPGLFARYPDTASMAHATPADIEPLIASVGLFRSKAKSLHATATALVANFQGQVPRRMEDLITLVGVGRKTANVVLGNAFGINVGVVVDTHVQRLTGRLALTKAATPETIEVELMKLFPADQWCMLSHLLIWHGRRMCMARKPACAACPVAQDCPSAAHSAR
jgi:endonuclease-3